MQMRSARLTGHPAFWPLAVATLALGISVAGITTPSIWYDEAATITSTTRTWPQLWAMLDNVDAVHALYYFLVHLVFDVFGYSPLALRLPSALAAAGAAAGVVVLGRMLGRRGLGVAAGLAFCLLPRVTWMGTEGRSYSFTALAAVLLTITLVHALGSSRRRAWVAYGVAAFLSTVLFVYLALVVVAHGVTLLWMLARRHPGSGTALRRWFVASAVGGLATMPVTLETIGQDGQVSWIHDVASETVRQVLERQWFYESPAFAVAAGALALLGVVATARDRRLLPVVIPALLLPTLLLLAYSVVASPLYQPRYLTMCTPFVALAVGAGITALRRIPLQAVALLLLAALAMPQILQQREPEAKERASWSEVARIVSDDRAADPADTAVGIVWGTVQRHPTASARVMAYSYPDAYDDTVDVTLRTPAGETAQLWETAAPLAESTDRLDGLDVVYLITSDARDRRPLTTEVLEAEGWGVVDDWSPTSVQIVKYERR
jgi:mannosyltransferase